MPETTALEAARTRRAEMEAAMQELEHAAAGPAKAPDWVAKVRAGLDRLAAALEQHVAAVEDQSGLFREVMTESPRVSPMVDRMRDDHARLSTLLDESRKAIAEKPQEGDPDVADAVRERVEQILELLSQHRMRGADLVYEAYGVDIGGQSG